MGDLVQVRNAQSAWGFFAVVTWTSPRLKTAPPVGCSRQWVGRMSSKRPVLTSIQQPFSLQRHGKLQRVEAISVQHRYRQYCGLALSLHLEQGEFAVRHARCDVGRNRSVKVGGGLGTRVGIGGFPIYLGGFKSVPKDELREVGAGELVLTNRRLLFLAGTHTIVIPLDRLLMCEQSNAGLVVSGAGATSSYLRSGERRTVVFSCRLDSKKSVCGADVARHHAYQRDRSNSRFTGWVDDQSKSKSFCFSGAQVTRFGPTLAG